MIRLSLGVILVAMVLGLIGTHALYAQRQTFIAAPTNLVVTTP